jgi:hypothetical protein
MDSSKRRRCSLQTSSCMGLLYRMKLYDTVYRLQQYHFKPTWIPYSGLCRYTTSLKPLLMIAHYPNAHLRVEKRKICGSGNSFLRFEGEGELVMR